LPDRPGLAAATGLEMEPQPALGASGVRRARALGTPAPAGRGARCSRGVRRRRASHAPTGPARRPGLAQGSDRSNLTHGSPSPTATPGTPLFLARWSLPLVAIRGVCEGSLFVCGETEVVLGLNRFHDPTDERPAVLLGSLLEELLDVVPNDGHLQCSTASRRA